MPFWIQITSLGDAGLMLPAALLMTVWLALMRVPRAALLWAGAFGGAVLLVVLTKIAFIGWGIGVHRLNFTGISGHATTSMAVLPVLLYLLSGTNHWRGYVFSGLGAILALLVAVSRVLLHDHSPSEAVSGAMLGGLVAASFILLARPLPARIPHMPVIALSLAAVLFADFGRPAPSHRLITWAALELSGRERPMTRGEWWIEGQRKFREAQARAQTITPLGTIR